MADGYELQIKLVDSDLDKQLKKIQDVFGKLNLAGGMMGGKGFTGIPHLDKLVQEMTKISKVTVRQAPVKERVFKKLDQLLSSGVLFPQPGTAPQQAGPHYDLETQSWQNPQEEEEEEEAPMEEESEKKTRQEQLMSGFGKLREVLGKIDNKQAALTGISFAVGGIFGLLTNASAILESTLKMITTGIMLMLKPIADVIGILLRPILLLFYQMVIGPFYTEVYPEIIKFLTSQDWADLMSNLASNISGGLAILEWIKTNIDNFLNPQDKLAKALSGANTQGPTPMESFKTWWGQHGPQLPKAWADSGTTIPTMDTLNPEKPIELLDEIPKAVEAGKQELKEWGADIDRDLTSVRDTLFGGLSWIGKQFETMWGPAMESAQEGWMQFSGFMVNMGSIIKSSLVSAWIDISNFFINLGGDVSDSLSTAWDATVQWFRDTANGISAGIGSAWDDITGWFSDVAGGIAAGIAASWKTITSTFESMVSLGTSVLSRIRSAWDSAMRFLENLNPFRDDGGGNSGGGSSGGRSPGRSRSSGGGPVHDSRVQFVGKNSRGGNRYTMTMASGGIIEEPIWGMGLNSGRNYLMGEEGPEVVTPMNKMMPQRAGRNIVMYNNINQADPETILQRAKQELSLDDKRLGVV